VEIRHCIAVDELDDRLALKNDHRRAVLQKGFNARFA
jgi:hypothetical protein